jgi:L-lactate dehydrogenase (cytochrome)
VAGSVNIFDVEAEAKRKLPRMVYDFIAGGAGDEISLEANRDAFARATLTPRALVDVSDRRSDVVIAGTKMTMPLVLGPAGLARLVDRDGELAVARAAGKGGIPFCLSAGSSFSIEEVAKASGGPLWFQVYLWRDRDLVGSLIRRASAAGYAALVVTVDVPLVGRRERDMRNGFSAPPRLSLGNLVDIGRRGRWLRNYLAGRRITFQNLVGEADDAAQGDSAALLTDYVNKVLTNASVGWEMIEWIRDLWSGPLIVKGVMAVEDAQKAVALGSDAVIVSNHGGRQLDGCEATLDALPRIASGLDGRVPVLVDGGVRRGADIIKAMSRGADGCLVVRPWWWGLAVGGEAGVSEVIEMLRSELDLTQGLMGITALSGLRSSAADRSLGPPAEGGSAGSAPSSTRS